MHDTDMAGILYFPRQFRYCHEALEDFVEQLGYAFGKVFTEGEFAFVVVHAEADYLKPLSVGDELLINLKVLNIGTTSFTIGYEIYREADGALVGTAKTAHVTLDRGSRAKIPVPEAFRHALSNIN